MLKLCVCVRARVCVCVCVNNVLTKQHNNFKEIGWNKFIQQHSLNAFHLLILPRRKLKDSERTTKEVREKSKVELNIFQDFPGNPVAKTPHSTMQGTWV